MEKLDTAISALLEQTYFSASTGGFVGTLKRCLQSHTEMVGIDVSERALKDAQSSYERRAPGRQG
jgi:hypothetical protein